MGKPNLPVGAGAPPGAGGPPGGGQAPELEEEVKTIEQRTKALLDEIVGEFSPGMRKCEIFVVSLAVGATVQKLITATLLVSNCIIQNISTEDVTLFTYPNGVAGQGTILNAATAAGKGGGHVSLGNIDLSKIYFVRTTAGVTLSVYYEA